jgi:hypothetical protein
MRALEPEWKACAAAAWVGSGDRGRHRNWERRHRQAPGPDSPAGERADRRRSAGHRGGRHRGWLRGQRTWQRRCQSRCRRGDLADFRHHAHLSRQRRGNRLLHRRRRRTRKILAVVSSFTARPICTTASTHSVPQADRRGTFAVRRREWWKGESQVAGKGGLMVRFGPPSVNASGFFVQNAGRSLPAAVRSCH